MTAALSKKAVAPERDATPAGEARGALRAAFLARDSALAAAEAARASSGRARALVGELAVEVERLETEERAIAEARAPEIHAAMRKGERPQLTSSPALPGIAAALAEARNRLAAATLAEAQLAKDEAKADLELTAAQNGVKAAIREAVHTEADALAARIEDLEDEAADLRERLGLHGYFLAAFLSLASGTRVGRVMAGTGPWLTNGKPMLRSQAFGQHWPAFAKALEQDAEAELTFD